jgi:hypothetical protein
VNLCYFIRTYRADCYFCLHRVPHVLPDALGARQRAAERNTGWQALQFPFRSGSVSAMTQWPQRLPPDLQDRITRAMDRRSRRLCRQTHRAMRLR